MVGGGVADEPRGGESSVSVLFPGCIGSWVQIGKLGGRMVESGVWIRRRRGRSGKGLTKRAVGPGSKRVCGGEPRMSGDVEV